ncbi:MAG: 2Fe-2S iron-sulfur cluster-binding protein, partial [Bacteroidota bacterium]
MPTIKFITQSDETFTLTADSGSVMELAVKHGIPGIDGDCGGVCSCATCHVHVAPEDWEKTGEPGDLEKDMLEFDDNVSPYSRLSC